MTVTAPLPRCVQPWRGVLASRGLRIDPGAHGAARRVLALWRPGARLLDHRGGPSGEETRGWLLLLPAPRWLRVEEAPGEVFAAVGATLASVRVSARQVGSLPVGALVR